MKIATFQVDVTPPAGAQLAYAINREQDTPIFVRGLILEDDATRVVWVACDFIYLWGDAWTHWRDQIAAAAATPTEQVFLHAVHQHDSVRIAPGMNPFLKPHGRVAVDETYCAESLAKVVGGISSALQRGLRSAPTILTAEQRLHGLASNRRLLGPDGKWEASRTSMCGDPALRARPVGVIDPLLRTIAFAGPRGEILAALHFYATHPMAAYGRGMVSQDVPGVALDYAGRHSDGFHLYFTGCAGNVTFGKYFLGDKEESMRRLGERLGRGMTSNMERLVEREPGRLRLAQSAFPFPFHPEIATMAGQENQPREEPVKPVTIAKWLLARERDQWETYTLRRLSMGPEVHLLSLHGEVCVEYQLYAQSLIPERFLACAAYGNCLYHYLPTAEMFGEGGYEPNTSVASPEIEQRLKTALRELLREL